MTTTRPQRRLLWIHQNLVTGRQAGNSRAVDAISAFLSRGWTIDLVCSQLTYLGQSGTQGDLHNEVQIQREGNLTIHRLPADPNSRGPRNRGAWYSRFAWESYRYAKGLPQPDLVFSSSPPLTQVVPSLAIAWWNRLPLVLEIRDLWPAAVVESGSIRFPPLILAMEWLEALSYRMADLVVNATPSYNPYLDSMGVSKERLAVVPTGGASRWTSGGNEAGEHWRTSHGLADRFVVLYAGSFNRHYRLELLLEAARSSEASNPDLAWVFAGAGLQENDIAAAAEQLENVHYLGPLPRDQLGPALLGSDLGIVTMSLQPVVRGVVPGKLFEYLAAGLPVLSLNDGAIGWMLRRSGGGLATDLHTSREIIDQVVGFQARRADELAAMGEAGRQWILRGLNSSKLSAALADRVDEVAETGRRPSLWRLVTAGLAAFAAVATRTSPRLVFKLLEESTIGELESQLDDWLEEHMAQEDPRGSRSDTLPTILSGSPGEQDPR